MTLPTDVSSSQTLREKYYLLTELGQGGTAIVNAAIALGMGGFSKIVVLKRIKAEFSVHHDAVSMFLNEARLSSRMNHPNVVQVYEVFEEKGLPIIVMEYLEGQSLAKILGRVFLDPIKSGFSVEVVASIIYRALEGLHYAHTLSDFNGKPLDIVHRDATPHNIMVTYTGQVKLLDFGIAKLNVGSDQTKTGVVKGKLGYMPREQVDGGAIDCRADVFAMGVVLWESVAGRRLWKGLGDAQIIRNLICDEIPSLASVVPNADPQLCRICERAMSPNPAGRYSTALELCADLEKFLSSRGGIASAARIAKLVNDSCEDLRQIAKTALDQQLAQFAERSSGSWDSSSGFSGLANASRPTRPTLEFSSGETNSNSSYLQASLSEASNPEPSRVWVWAVLGLVAITCVAVFGAREKTTTVGSAPQLDGSTASSSLPEPKPTIELIVVATPQSAKIYIDGIISQSNPHNAIIVQDLEKHEVLVQAPGYISQRRTVDFLASGQLIFSLIAEPVTVDASVPVVAFAPKAHVPKPVPRRAKRAKRAKRARKAVLKRKIARPTAKTPTKPIPSKTVERPKCTSPYFINENGNKEYRRECL